MFNLKIIDKFKEGPKSFKIGVLLLCLGWALVYWAYFILFKNEPVGRQLYLLLGVGVSICLLVAAARPWARKMTLFFNIAIILFFTILFYDMFFVEKILLIHMISIPVIISFAASIYFLFKKDTANFFILHDPKREESTSSDAEKT